MKEETGVFLEISLSFWHHFLAVHSIQIGRVAQAAWAASVRHVAHSSRDPQPNHLHHRSLLVFDAKACQGLTCVSKPNWIWIRWRFHSCSQPTRGLFNPSGAFKKMQR